MWWGAALLLAGSMLGLAFSWVARAPAAAGPCPPAPSPETETNRLPEQTGTLWAPYLEWSLENPSYSGNPFDVAAQATFVHRETGEIRRTGMFYAGDDTWKFRFSGTRTGLWSFSTCSADPHLDGHSGRAVIAPNPDPDIKGFLVSHDNGFARQVGESGELEPVLLNIWQGGFPNGVNVWHENPDLHEILDRGIDDYILAHGMTALYSGSIGNRWFNLETRTWDEHDSEDPDLRTFQALERAIAYLHSRGVHLHIWMWGDEDRRQTPIGVGGINGEPDRRLQRYLAARLGPLPGWSLSYGIDLGDRNWLDGDPRHMNAWAKYLNHHMGWTHLLFTRGYAPANVSGVSYASNGPESYQGDLQTSPNGPADYDEVVGHLESDPDRPHLFEERFIYLREFADGPPWTMERTRRVLWWNSMAGGAGAFWGVWDGPLPPNPEQMRTHARFWEDRLRLDLRRANHLTDGHALLSPSEDARVFYEEATSSVRMDLSEMEGPGSAVAVDTRSAYEEISLGRLSPGEHVWTAPYESDWVVAVGFDE